MRGSVDRLVGYPQALNRRLWTARVAVDGHARIETICYGEDGPVERRSGRGVYLVAAGIALVVIGWVMLKALVALIFYILVGLLVVGGGMYLYYRARRALGGDGRRPRIGPR